jgi:hypothetical protein
MTAGRRSDPRLTTDMRVLHVYGGNLYGGIETMLVTLARTRSLCPALDQEVALCFDGRLSVELAATGILFIGCRKCARVDRKQ